jgi:ComF family protein
MRSAELAAHLRSAERWLLPGECLLCRDPVGDGDPLVCPPCQSRWRRLPEPQCRRCGQPDAGVTDACRVCAAWPEGFVRARSAVWLDEHARAAVHHLKYAGWWRVAEPMARLMARLPLSPGVLVPVPLAAGRFRRRGYNQAGELAEGLNRLTRWPVEPSLLARPRDTRTQTRLAPEARRANIAQAFAAAVVRPGACLVLVDDVFTTGATLAEAASTLLEAGAAAVEAVTFARARPPIADSR